MPNPRQVPANHNFLNNNRSVLDAKKNSDFLRGTACKQRTPPCDRAGSGIGWLSRDRDRAERLGRESRHLRG